MEPHGQHPGLGIGDAVLVLDHTGADYPASVDLPAPDIGITWIRDRRTGERRMIDHTQHRLVPEPAPASPTKTAHR